MPRFFVHVHDGTLVISDFEGIDFASTADAIEDTRLAAREMLNDRLRAGASVDGLALHLCDTNAQTVQFIALIDMARLLR